MRKAKVTWSTALPHTSDTNFPSEWSKTGSLINKPPRGWLHPDGQVMDGGISYGVRYIGCIEINTSMKTLDFDFRSVVAKECINRVCEAAGMKTMDKKRKTDKRVLRMLAEKPNMDHAGTNISLVITSSFISLAIMESGKVIVNHDMPNVSFASGGEADTLDFVAYVAKDIKFGRACFVLECGSRLAQDVITTIGQAFELRFKEFLKKTPRTLMVPNRLENPVFNSDDCAWGEDPEYYNDIQRKVAAEGPPPLPPLPDYHQTSQEKLAEAVQPTSSFTEFSLEPLLPENQMESEPEQFENACEIESEQPPPPPRHRCTDSSVPNPPPHAPTSSSPIIMTSSKPKWPAGLANHRVVLLQEDWFHGPISRKESEAFVVRDGDFLVRESQGSPGQYVLTGMQSGVRKHLLLVDPEGVVRTKDRTFESVTHLVSFHCDNSLPIISAESTLLLKNPIPRVGYHHHHHH